MTRQIETAVGINVAGVITVGLIAIVSTIAVLIWIGGFGDEPLAKDSAAHSSPLTSPQNTPLVTPGASNSETPATSELFERSPAGGETMDKSEAMKWIRMGAEQEFAEGQFNLGICCELVTKDFGEAVKWFKKSAAQGNRKAADKLEEFARIGYRQ